MIEYRTAAQWADLPIEWIAQLPERSYDKLWKLIVARDPWIVQNRK